MILTTHKHLRLVILLLVLITGVVNVYAQDNVGIGTANPDASAILDLTSTNKGLLAPRMTQAQRDAIPSPATGLLIYNLTTDSFQYNFGTPVVPAWNTVIGVGSDGGTSSEIFWSLLGNNALDSTRHYLGSSNAQPLIIRTNNIQRIKIGANGGIDITGATGVTGSLSLQGLASPLLLNGSAGNINNVLVSRGPGQTPLYTDSLQLSSLTTTNLTATNATILASFTTSGPAFFGDSVTFTILPKLPLQRNNFYIGNQNNLATAFPPGQDSTVLGMAGGQPAWIDINSLIATKSWLVGGNNAPTSSIIGNTAPSGVRDLDVRAGNTSLIYLNGTNPNIELRAGITVPGNDKPLSFNGQQGFIGNPLVSSGPGFTPQWTSAMVITDTGVTVSAPKFTTSLNTTVAIAGPSTFNSNATFNDVVEFGDTVTFLVPPKLPLAYGHMWVGNAQGVAAEMAPGLNGAVLVSFGGRPQWVEQVESPFWSRLGNDNVGLNEYLGTSDGSDLRISTNATTRLTISGSTGSLTAESLSGAPQAIPQNQDDGLLYADANGTISKRDRSSLLAMLGIYGGRYTNGTSGAEFTVVITLPVGVTLDSQASITITPEATTSVSITPFIVNGSRTANAFTISFPGGLNPGESINWLVRNP